MAKAIKVHSTFSVQNILALLLLKCGLAQESKSSVFFLENKFQIPNNCLKNQLETQPTSNGRTEQ